MAIELKGEVGRTGRPEDVAIVQTLLANIKGSDGRPFWDRRVDGRAGADLAAAIEAFQRRWIERSVLRDASVVGVVRPASPTWRLMVARFAAEFGDPGMVAGNPPLIHASRDARGVAANTAALLRRGDSSRERMIAHRLRLGLAGAVEAVAGTVGVGLSLDRTALAGDRVAMRFVPVGLSVLDGSGRPLSMDGRAGDVPKALWAEIDRAMTRQAAVEPTGNGGYQPRDGLAALREEPSDTMLPARFGIDPREIRGDKRPVLAALALIARIDRLSQSAEDELLHLFDIVAADDPGMAELLRRTRDTASRGAVRQPEAVGAGPSPFEQAVDQMLRTIVRNYQSSRMAQLRSLLTLDPRDRYDAWMRFIDLVNTGKPWDIKREFPRWVRDTAEGVEYGSDLWGNLHYGYMGKAAGFTEGELWLGAQGQAVLSTDMLDDVKDQAAIQVGYALWDEHRFPIPRGALIDALRRGKKDLNTR